MGGHSRAGDARFPCPSVQSTSRSARVPCACRPHGTDGGMGLPGVDGHQPPRRGPQRQVQVRIQQRCQLPQHLFLSGFTTDEFTPHLFLFCAVTFLMDFVITFDHKMDQNTSYSLKIKLLGNRKKGRKESRTHEMFLC